MNCGYCGLPGHQRPTCHIEAEGRREPDQADRDAAALVGACIVGGRVDPLKMRAALAQTYRVHRTKMAELRRELRDVENAFKASLLDEQ